MVHPSREASTLLSDVGIGTTGDLSEEAEAVGDHRMAVIRITQVVKVKVKAGSPKETRAKTIDDHRPVVLIGGDITVGVNQDLVSRPVRVVEKKLWGKMEKSKNVGLHGAVTMVVATGATVGVAADSEETKKTGPHTMPMKAKSLLTMEMEESGKGLLAEEVVATDALEGEGVGGSVVGLIEGEEAEEGASSSLQSQIMRKSWNQVLLARIRHLSNSCVVPFSVAYR